MSEITWLGEAGEGSIVVISTCEGLTVQFTGAGFNGEGSNEEVRLTVGLTNAGDGFTCKESTN